MPLRDDRATLSDIQYYCERIIGAVASSSSREEFATLPYHFAAVERWLTIIGEAVKRLSSNFRDQHPHIDWRGWAGLRDVVMHGYDIVDYIEIWETITRDVPGLLTSVTLLLAEIEASEQPDS